MARPHNIACTGVDAQIGRVGKKAWTPGNWRQAVDMFQSRLWVQGRFTEPVTWLWPANPYIPPDKEWVLGRELWEKKHGPPAGWVATQEVTD